jgi:integrase
VHIKVEAVFFEEQMILIAKAKGGKSRYVLILPEIAQELRTPVGQSTVGYLFETNRATRYSPRRIQQIIKRSSRKRQGRHRSPSACIRIFSGTPWQPRS